MQGSGGQSLPAPGGERLPTPEPPPTCCRRYRRSCVRLAQLQPEGDVAQQGSAPQRGAAAQPRRGPAAQRAVLSVMHSAQGLEMQLADPQGGEAVHPHCSRPPFRCAAGLGSAPPRPEPAGAARSACSMRGRRVHPPRCAARSGSR
jgi:hypothetical protein